MIPIFSTLTGDQLVSIPTRSVVQVIPSLSDVAFQKLPLDLSQVVLLEHLYKGESTR